MLTVGLTGPTGAGKSTAALWLAEKGCTVIDCDALARRVTAVGSPTLPALADAFGEDILLPDGSLDRALLAARAFADPAATARLNAVTHPAILALVRERLEELRAADTAVAVIDAPVLYESGLDAACDTVLAVLADRETRIARIRARDGISRRAAILRMSAQPNKRFYLGRGAVPIYNNGDTAALTARLSEVTAGWPL